MKTLVIIIFLHDYMHKRCHVAEREWKSGQ